MKPKIMIMSLFFGGLILLAGFIGCGKNNLTGPDDPSLQSAEKPFSYDQVAPVVARGGRGGRGGGGRDLQIAKETYKGNKITKEIDQSGGYLEIPVPDYTNYFYVPSQALNSKDTLSVQITQGLNSAGEELSQYDFWPDGLKFNKTAYLYHRTSTPDGTPVELYRYNSVTVA